MNLTIVGSGTMMPTKKRNPSAFLLETQGTRILIDCGLGTLRRLVDGDIDPQSIDILFISHFHADHVGDAFHLIQARFVDDLYYGRKHRRLLVIGPQGIKKRFLQWRDMFWLEPAEQYPVEFLEGPLTHQHKDIHMRMFEVNHVPWFQSVGLWLKAEGKTLVYPGDIGSHHDQVDLLRQISNADMLLIEAAATKPTPNHLTIKQVQEFVEKAFVRKALIVHVRPDMEDMLKAQLAHDRYIELAHDGMVVNV